MDAVDGAEAVAGGLLLFVVPGFTIARALFPEWRFRGPDGARHALETATLAFVLSVALTVLVGSALLGVAPGGFAAAWSDPLLETVLAAIAVVGAVAGVLRGAYARVPPTPPAGPEDDEDGAFELTRELDRLYREERRLSPRARGTAASEAASADIEQQRAELKDRIDALEQRREEQYAR